VGIVLSAMADMPTGAVTVWTMAGVALVAGLAIGKQRGAAGQLDEEVLTSG
jgi:hypothetical protein